MRSGKKSQYPAKRHATPVPVASEVAKMANCSRTLATRLLQRGFSVEQIVSRCERRRQIEAAKLAASIPSISVPVPSEPLDGAASTFVFHQVRKERALADLREIQVLKARGEVLPVEPLRSISIELVRFQQRELNSWPGELSYELADQPQRVCMEILERHVQYLREKSEAFYVQEIARHGIHLADEVANEEPPEPQAA
jgi:hypothetical protein